MKIRLKPIADQVIVITGASSGIGLATARMAADTGAKVVVAARSEPELKQLVREIELNGGEAAYIVADVGQEDDVIAIAEAAEQEFGRIDTWVNNAGVSIYGRVLEVPINEQRQLFETNFWGLVYGCRVAAQCLRRRGGAIINVGSTVSDRAIPLQGTYSASKHAVKGFTDALRMELEEEGAPISVSLIKPGAIDTPYTRHARNYLGSEPKNPPPLYAPEVVAEAILHCAEHPERDVFVGAGGKAISALGTYAPRLMDKIMEFAFFKQQVSGERPARGTHRSLFEPSHDLHTRSGYKGHVAESSAYTKASLHPMITSAVAVGTGLALAAIWKSQSGGDGVQQTNEYW